MSVVRSFINRFDGEYTKRKNRLEEYEDRLMARERSLEEAEKCLIHMISPDRICPNRSQPRTVFDDESIFSLAESIRNYGIIQPLTVRRLAREDEPFGGLYELISGERRLRASKIVGCKYVPCMIIDSDAEESAKMALVENLQRQDLNMFDEASAISNLCNTFGLKQEEVAATLGVSQSYVANKLRLLRFEVSERNLIIRNCLTERHARALLRITDGVERSKLLNEVIEHSYNVAQTEELVSDALNVSSAKAKPKRKLLLKDIRIFLNSVDRAVVMIRDAGFDIERSKREVGENIELVIRIPKNKYTENLK